MVVFSSEGRKMSVPHEIRDRRGGMTLNSVTKVCTGEIWTLLNILSVTSQGTIILTICKTVYSLTFSSPVMPSEKCIFLQELFPGKIKIGLRNEM